MLIKLETLNGTAYLNTNHVESIITASGKTFNVTTVSGELHILDKAQGARLLNFMEYIDEHDKERGSVYPVEGGNNTG